MNEGDNMRKVIVMLMIVAITGTAIAQDLGSSRDLPAKSMTEVQYTPPTGGNRQGGDDIYSAVPIYGLPYTNTGTTNGFLDDYDVACPYTDSTSPDVVYSYTPATNEAVSVDLCGSSYDTKAYILDSALTPIACNDDFHYDDICGYYTSLIEGAVLTGGETYYIVVDGYYGDFGDYAIAVDSFIPCVVACPADAVPEGEPTMYDGYADEYNSGCNGVSTNNFQAFNWINDEDGLPPFDGCGWMCGKSGWHLNATGGEERDTDWFVATALTTGLMTFTVESEYPCNIYQLIPSPMDCLAVDVGLSAIADCGAPATLSIPVIAGEVVYLWVGPTTYTGPVLEFNYSMTVCNHEFESVSNEDMNWGQVKDLYK